MPPVTLWISQFYSLIFTAEFYFLIKCKRNLSTLALLAALHKTPLASLQHPLKSEFGMRRDGRGHLSTYGNSTSTCCMNREAAAGQTLHTSPSSEAATHPIPDLELQRLCHESSACTAGFDTLESLLSTDCFG